MQKAIVYGPACDMSMTSGGYYLKTDDHWVRSTVVVAGNHFPGAGEAIEEGDQTSEATAVPEGVLLEEEERPVMAISPHDREGGSQVPGEKIKRLRQRKHGARWR